MTLIDCKNHAAEIKEIEDSLEGKYGGVFVTTKAGFLDIKERIKRDLNKSVNDSALDCFIYNKLGMGKLTPYLMDDELEEIMVIGPKSPVYILNRKGENFATMVIGGGVVIDVTDRIFVDGGYRYMRIFSDLGENQDQAVNITNAFGRVGFRF